MDSRGKRRPGRIAGFGPDRGGGGGGRRTAGLLQYGVLLRRSSWTTPALIAALATAGPLRAEEPAPPAEVADEEALPDALLPEASFQLVAARYAPGEPDQQWTTWIGAGIGLARVGGTTFFGTADLETILGDERRAFDARQANYHLQLGARRGVGPWTVELFFDHVSRHVVDREKEPAVDWNVLGLRASRTLGTTLPTRVSVGVGHTTLASAVGYRFEATAGVESDVARWRDGLAYLRGRLRLVSVSQDDSELDRGGFADGSLEAGVRFPRGPRALELFVAWDHRNDVRLLEPGALNRALFGLRFTGGPPDLLASQSSGLGPRPGAASVPPPPDPPGE